MTGGLHVGVVGVGRIGAFHAGDAARARRRRGADPGRRRPGRVARRVARELGAGDGRDPRGARRAAGVDALVIATGDAAATPRCSGSRPRPASRRSARSRSRSSSRRSTTRHRRGRARRDPRPGRASSGASTPGYRAARDAVATGRARQAARRPRGDARSGAAAGGVHRDLRRHLPRPPHPRLRRDPLRDRARRSSRSTPTGPSARRRGSSGTATSTRPWPSLRLGERRARDPLGDAPRPARLRRPARGLRDRRQHRRRRSTTAARSARSSRAGPPRRAGLRELHRPLRARLPSRARRLRRRGARAAAGARAPLAEARAALAVASPPTGRAPSGGRSRSRRWLARKRSQR